MRLVTFRGDGPMLPALLRGDLDFGAPAVSSIRGREFRPLAVFSGRRHPAFPEVPTVRELGVALGLPHEMVWRHPFPGPGLAVRVLGELTEERIAIVREADDVFIKALREHGHYDSVWQAFAVLLPVKSVGVMGDNRTYQETIALRAVNSSDAMTAGVGELPMSFLTRVAADIVKKVPGVNRVVYDITTKPPATIEWE